MGQDHARSISEVVKLDGDLGNRRDAGRKTHRLCGDDVPFGVRYRLGVHEASARDDHPLRDRAVDQAPAA